MRLSSAPWHWPEYLIEGVALGLFMCSAALFTVGIEHPDSPIRQAIDDPLLRRLFMGLAMGGTAIALIYSPAGARSGAHMNPATTLTFARLGRIAPRDAMAYVVAQFLGAIAGLETARVLLAPWIGHPAVNFVATVPGRWGVAAAFGAEVAIAFILMTVVLIVSNSRHERWTGVAAGVLVATFILSEAPVSGMSLNPARSFAPALFANGSHSTWIYFAAPVVGMAIAAEAFVRRRGAHAVHCAKLNHAGTSRCIFRCRRGDVHAQRAA